MQTAQTAPTLVAGVDTHKDTHTASALDLTGRCLGTETFPATQQGYVALVAWLKGLGYIARIGVEGTGSYGAGLTRHLHAEGISVLEVNRPNRQARRRHGKSDPADAQSAARAALSGDALGAPKTQDGVVEVLRMLRVQRRSAILARTQAANQLHAVVSTAPEPLRTELRALSLSKLIAQARAAVTERPTDLTSWTRQILQGLACRWVQLDHEVQQVDAFIAQLLDAAAPQLLALRGVGPEVASTLLVAAGDNPQRLAHEASFAALCGVSPVDASSGRQHRHRLNRGGNRDANRALWVIALVRLRCDPRTREYAARRTQQGLSKPEILRCLKRYIAREIFRILRSLQPTRTLEVMRADSA